MNALLSTIFFFRLNLKIAAAMNGHTPPVPPCLTKSWLSYTSKFMLCVWGLCLVVGDLVAEPPLDKSSQLKETAPHVSAAEIDWVPRSQLNYVEIESIASFCHGYYRQPDWLTELIQQQSDLIDLTSLPIAASAETADYNAKGSSTLFGGVIITQGSRRFRAELASVDERRESVYLEGDVQIRQPDLLIRGDSGRSDLVSRAGEINNASFLIHSAGLRGEATQVTNTAENRVIISNGRFTRCEPDSNFWYLKGKQINLLTEEHYGTARNVVIEIKDVPVLYLPYLRFPLGDERSSGLLIPVLGHSSDGGSDISLPYYFNLAPNYDATYTPRSIWKRGLVNQGQFRFMSEHSYNVVNAAFLTKDNEYDDRSLLTNEDGSLMPVGEFEEQDRWFLNLRHTGGWNKRLQSVVRYSAVSDNDYLRDIGGDVDSAAIEQHIGGVDQSITNRRTAALHRFGEVTYYGDYWDISTRVQGFQLLDSTATESYERLPQLIGHYRNKWRSFLVSASSELTYFDRNNDDLTGSARIVGGRFVLDTKASLPLRERWGFLEPGLLYKHRSYDIRDTPTGVDTRPTISVPGVSLDSGLFFERPLQADNNKLIQTLEPRAYFLWVAEDEQNSLPSFDSVRLTPSFNNIFRDDRFGGSDRIGDAKQVSLGVTSRILDSDTGTELMKGNLGQIYYFKDRQVRLPSDPTGIDNQANSSALFTGVKVSMFRDMTMSGTLEWDPNENRTNRTVVSFQYQTAQHQLVNLRYSYSNADVQITNRFVGEEESDISFLWPIMDQWQLLGRWNYGWDRKQTIESLVGIEYNDCCWGARLAFRRYLKSVVRNTEPGLNQPSTQALDVKAETGIFLEFQLKGLGTIGHKLNSLFDESINGYRDIEESYAK
jgi:LPS-assembly protein